MKVRRLREGPAGWGERGGGESEVNCRERLQGLLRYYYRDNYRDTA